MTPFMQLFNFRLDAKKIHCLVPIHVKNEFRAAIHV